MAKTEGDLMTMQDFAAEMDVHRGTISDLVIVHSLPTHAMSNHKAKGLAPPERAFLRTLLTPRTAARRPGAKTTARRPGAKATA